MILLPDDEPSLIQPPTNYSTLVCSLLISQPLHLKKANNMLLYSIIARSSDGIVLVEATTAGVEGNHPQITNQLVQKLIANPSLIPLGVRKTFVNNVHEGLSRDDTSGNEDGDIEMKGFWNGWGAEEIYYEQESLEHFFHVQRDESVYFICLSDDKDGQQHRR